VALAVLVAWASPGMAQSESPPPVEAQTEPGFVKPESPEAWDDLARGVAIQLEGLRPEIEAFEVLDRPLKPEETKPLESQYKEIRPKVQALRQRRELVSKEARKQAKEWSDDLFSRLEVLLQKTQAFAAPEEAKNAPQIESMISNIAFYGSLRGRAFWNDQGTTFDDSTSRIGLRGQLDVSRTYEFIGRFEVGTNMVGDLSRFLIGGDPGTEEGSEDRPIPLRLAFVGFEGPQGRVTFGKQWSTFYDVGVFTDQAPFFGGVASGVYAAGTDGGISGTGRANQALQYRFAIPHFKFGVQTQIRNLTSNDQSFVDTWGVSAVYQFDEGVTLGAAFNQVRDGITDPFPDEPIYGDQALIAGARWQNDDNYYAVTYTDFENHERDDEGEFYSGFGVELYADHLLTERFGIGGTFNYQKPDDDLMSDYLINFLSVGGGYFLGDKWRFYLIYKFENSQRSDGTPLGEDTLGAAVFYNFSWGFAPF
jgi:predicted porin